MEFQEVHAIWGSVRGGGQATVRRRETQPQLFFTRLDDLQFFSRVTKESTKKEVLVSLDESRREEK